MPLLPYDYLHLANCPEVVTISDSYCRSSFKTYSLTENQFSAKSYFYTPAPGSRIRPTSMPRCQKHPERRRYANRLLQSSPAAIKISVVRLPPDRTCPGGASVKSRPADRDLGCVKSQIDGASRMNPFSRSVAVETVISSFYSARAQDGPQEMERN